MEVLLVFLITIAFIFLMAFSRRVPAFVFLLAGAILFGLLAGAGPDQTLKWIVNGIGSTFGPFALVILSGIVIVRLLADQGLIRVMAEGIHRRIRNPRVAAGILGYLLAVPITCPIVTYWVLAPAIKHLEPEKRAANAAMYAAALGAIISYILIFPTPVTQPLFEAFAKNSSSLAFDAVTIPLSFCILLVMLAVSAWWFLPKKGAVVQQTAATVDSGTGPQPGSGTGIRNLQFRAWAPFIAILAAIPVGLLLLNLSHVGIMQFVMLAGLATALVLAPREIRFSGLSEGAKTAGLILFDICAAGAIGTVVIQTGLAKAAVGLMMPILPAILIPFLIAVVLATAQGGRVVTAVVSAQVIGATALVNEIHPLPLILMVAAGSCIVCHLTDPFFWSVKGTTGDDEKTILRNYTVPLACIGAVIFVVALVLALFVFPISGNAAIPLNS